MNWEQLITAFNNYLKIERSLSGNSVQSYVHDVRSLNDFLKIKKYNVLPSEIKLKHLIEFINYLNKEYKELGLTETSQARILSGIRAFYKFLLIENMVVDDPTVLIELPRIVRKLPVSLELPEIDKMLSCIDLSKQEGHRNKAIIETLYGCGLRVTELCELKISNIFFREGFIKVTGKGNKERLVPLGSFAEKSIKQYLNEVRVHQKIGSKHTDTVFLNRRGTGLSRVFVFMIIKDLAQLAGIEKVIGPHTFRHSFATHLIEGGADLRAVQEMLGHSSILTTEIYLHMDKEYLRSNLIDFHPRSDKNLSL